MSAALKQPLTVVYNSKNHSSAAEIRLMKQHKKASELKFVDVAEGANSADYGCEPNAVLETIHVQDADGKVVSGMDAIGEMHRAIGLWSYFQMCRMPGLKTGPSGFYKGGAENERV